MNQMRGFLLERGMTVRKGPSHLLAQLQEVLCEGGAFFSARLRGLLRELEQEWDELDRRIEQANDELQRIARKDDACHRLMEVPGFGPLVSTLVAAIGNGITFRKGRDLSAWIGRFRAGTRPAARRNCWVSANEETPISGACSCMAHDPS
jgi:transposase